LQLPWVHWVEARERRLRPLHPARRRIHKLQHLRRPAANWIRRNAHAAPAPAPQPVLQPVYVYSPDGYLVTYGAPYEVLSDGSVLVNFGYGYERVLRQCAPSSSQTQVNQNGRDALGRILEPPGIAALKAGTRGEATGVQPPRNASACYRANQAGRVEMVTERATGVRP
jgi:hypothetical protein